VRKGGGQPVVEVIESYKRVAREPGFIDRFYRRFFDSDPEVARRFEGVDMARQRFVVERTVTLLLQHASGLKHGTDVLREVATRHGPSDLDIPPYLYDLWADALVHTVAEHDPRFSPDLEQQWRALLRKEVDWFIRIARPDV
jgi:hemoglobin-like flavoprotein